MSIPMSDIPRFQVEAGELGDVRSALQIAISSLIGAVIALVTGLAMLGSEGMTNPKSPDFFPLPHLFIVAGAGLAVMYGSLASLRWARRQIFGASSIEGNVPVLGGVLEGRLNIEKPQALGQDIVLTLRCNWSRPIRDIGQTDGRVREATSTLWQKRIVVAKPDASADIAFSFEIPADGLASGQRPKPARGVHPLGAGSIAWVLTATSRGGGIGFSEDFTIPVESPALSRKGAKSTPHDTAEPTTSAGLDPDLPTQLLAAALGGHAPSADEISSDEAAARKSEPSHPFARSAAPVTDGQLRFTKFVYVLTGLCWLGAIYSIGMQVSLMVQGESMPASIVAVNGKSVTLDFGPDDPAHPLHVSNLHSWNVGQKVAARCIRDEEGHRKCRMESGLDRWVDPSVMLMIALVLLGLAVRKPWCGWRTDPNSID